MKTFQVTNRRRFQYYTHVMQKGDAETIQFDLSGWVEDNGTVTTATWTLKSGNVSVGTSSLASNVTSAKITASNVARARIVITATDGTDTISLTLLIKVEEPTDLPTYDYGFIS